MASEPFKPLVDRRRLDDARGGHILPLHEEQSRIVASWATSAGNGPLLSQQEKPLQGQFLSQVCDRLLGYRQIVSGEGIHRMEPETNSNAVKGYRPPDARLGWYGSGVDRTRAVLELKAPGADVDAEQGGS